MAQMSLRGQAISSVKWNGIATAITVLLQFSTLIVLSRLLNPADFGLIGMLVVVTGLAQLFMDMGVSNAIIHRQDATRNQLASLYWLNLFAGLAVFLLVFASTPLVIMLYHEPRLATLLYLASLNFLIIPVGQQFNALLQRDLRFGTLARIEILSASANTATALVFACTGAGALSVVFGQLARAICQAGMLCWLGFRCWKPSLHFSARDLDGYVGFGFYQMGEKFVNYMTLNVDYLLIGSLLGAQPLGYYSLAFNLTSKPVSLANPVVTRVAFPLFAKVQQDPERLKKAYLKVLEILSSVNFPVMIGLIALAPAVIPLLFGYQWEPSIFLTQILAIVSLLRSTGNPVGALMLSQGRADMGFWWNLMVVAIQVPGLYLGLRLGGIVGVAVAFALLQGVYKVFGYRLVIRRLLASCLREYLSAMWPVFWKSVAAGSAMYVTGALLHGYHGIITLMAQVFSGLVVYLLLVFFRQRYLLTEFAGVLFGKT
jgi:lipopolysaccharide exporter